MSIRRFIFLNEKLFMKIKKHILFTFFKPMYKILYRRNKRQSFLEKLNQISEILEIHVLTIKTTKKSVVSPLL